jgi:integrase
MVKRQHIKLMLDHIKQERTWSNHAYNKHLGYIAGVISRLVDYEIIENNPAHKIKALQMVETMKFEPLEENEKIILKDVLTTIHPNYFTYLMVIYHTGIRPKEALALKISDVNLSRGVIVIKPDLELENSKTKTIRVVPINDHLLILLNQHLMKGYPNHYYLFGSPFEAGVGNRGAGSATGKMFGAARLDYLEPSPNAVKRDTVTKLWKKLVKDKIGIDKFQYALKHTGATDKILAGIDLDALKSLYGHSSKFMTMKYVSGIKNIHNDKIRKLSPDF